MSQNLGAIMRIFAKLGIEKSSAISRFDQNYKSFVKREVRQTKASISVSFEVSDHEYL